MEFPLYLNSVGRGWIKCLQTGCHSWVVDWGALPTSKVNSIGSLHTRRHYVCVFTFDNELHKGNSRMCQYTPGRSHCSLVLT